MGKQFASGVSFDLVAVRERLADLLASVSRSHGGKQSRGSPLFAGGGKQSFGWPVPAAGGKQNSGWWFDVIQAIDVLSARVSLLGENAGMGPSEMDAAAGLRTVLSRAAARGVDENQVRELFEQQIQKVYAEIAKAREYSKA